MPPTLGGGTQDTDFKKGFTKGIFPKHIRRRNGGGQGDPDPPVFSVNCLNDVLSKAGLELNSLFFV